MTPTEGLKMNWISVEDIPKVFAGKFKIKRENGQELEAYFYQDAMRWITFYGRKACYWWDCKTLGPIYDVTHWMPLPSSPEKQDN